MSNDTPEPHDAASRASGSGGKSCLLFATLLAGLIISGVFFALKRIGDMKKDLPPLVTREIFDEAWDRWEANPPANYAIEIDVVGPRTAKYAVEVVDNAVTTATHNGDPLPQVARTMRTWSVPGMFDTMEHDVMRIEQPNNSDLEMRAEFDPDLGLPRKYYRNDKKNGFNMRWTVTKFKVGSGEPEENNDANKEEAAE